MFKADWEKTSITHLLPQGMVEKMVRFAYPDKKLISRELIAGGCANLNIKILVEDQESPQISQTYIIGEVEGYCFAITTLDCRGPAALAMTELSTHF